ncbi:hypothetical protein HC248_01432 [Polaromonas vacuolata]|uniref:DUF927 domain-containing protein n=1 Tax=Polaromonas vacuolata TaxID=37448 RepID=A0A6H2H9I5_9BURK|nr:hypothetical protein [Polaromonas vacuolata]QJC56146.1 hypothetical protein HC248_01432 [Polaromonas vacuolata]
MTNTIKNDGTPLNNSVEKTRGGYKALGMSGAKCVVLSGLNSSVVKLSHSEMNEMGLIAHFGALWCDENYSSFNPKREEHFFDHRAMASKIFRDCQACGPYIESHERGTGVWLGKDGQLLVNGQKLWSSEGEVLEHGVHDGRVYPANGDVGFDLSTPEANDDDVNKVFKALGGVNWRQPLAAELILGWFGMACISAALPRRPHVMLVGPAGCGKTTALDTVKFLLGPLAFGCTGPQRMAGYYQSLSGTTRAAAVDEFEGGSSSGYSLDTYLIARMSYSLQESDEGIIRGTPGGAAKSYRFYTPFIAACVNPPKMEPADISRWTILDAMSRKENAVMMSESEAREIGPKLARRFIARWSVYQASEKVVRKCILAAGGDGRMADTVGTLLASYWTFVSNQPATEDDANVLVEMLDIKARIELHSETDEKRCLDSLMSKVMPFKVVQGNYLVTRSLSIAQAVALVCEDPTCNPEIIARLSQLGLRVVKQNGKWQLFVVNSPEHQELRKVFAGTKWSTGGWSVVLRRLPGGGESTQRIGAGLGAAKVTIFDIPADLASANDEECRLMAA